MRPCLVEVHDIGIEHALELLLLKNQQMVQAFLSNAPQEPLTDGIGSWRMIGGFEQLDVTCLRHTGKARPEFAIVITNEIFRSLTIGSRFSQLLGDPGIGRRACHTHMDDPSGLEFDEEEGEERSKEQISDLQEVACPDLSGVVAQKGRPLLASWPLGANASHVFLYRPLADPYAQFQEFAANPLCTPEPIVPRHLSDQDDCFLGDLGLARSGLGLTLPIQAKELPMPPEKGVWLHDQEGLLPGTNQPGKPGREGYDRHW